MPTSFARLTDRAVARFMEIDAGDQQNKDSYHAE